MIHEGGVRYLIDSHDELCFVDSAWDQFAADNDGADAAGPGVLGRSLWDFITDDATRHLYRQILHRVRKGRKARFTLRCDGPEHRRLLEMNVAPHEEGAVEFVSHVIGLETRRHLPLLERQAPRAEDQLSVCSWCSQVNVGEGTWIDVEAAIQQLGLFRRPAMPTLIHGVCSGCFKSMMHTIAQV